MNASKITAPLYAQDGKEQGSVQLPGHLFSLPWSPQLIHQIVTGIEKNRRSMTAHTKGRSAVRGGGRKPWRQKGTGRARHGSIRSPLWVGGGVTFGPDAEKNYSVGLNKKMSAKSLFVALSERVRNGAVAFVDDIVMEQPSTKAAVSLVNALCPDTAAARRCLFVFADKNDAVLKSLANIPGVSASSLATVHTRDILVPAKIIFVHPEKTLTGLEARASAMKKQVSSVV